MQIKVRGELSLPDIRKALVEQLVMVEEKCGAGITMNATLYIRPTYGYGDDAVPQHRDGEPVAKFYRDGPYRGAADQYQI